MRDEPLPHDSTLARHHGEDTLGDAGLEGEVTEPKRRQRGQLGRLEHHGVAGGERGTEPPPGDRHREVPRHDDADDPERLPEGDVDAAGDRDLASEVPLGRTGVVGEDVADVARLPAGVADRVPGVRDLEQRELLLVVADEVGEAPQEQRAVRGGDGGPPRGGRPRTGNRLVGLLEGGEWHRRDDLLGGWVDDVVRLAGDAHSRSNPLLRSQSVTAALKAVISTSAALT
jgi:hypothetical protein